MSEIQESYALLQQIDSLLADIELKINNIEQKAPQLERNLDNFRQIERLAIRWLVIARRMGLPEDVEQGINRISQLIVSIRMLQMATSLLYSTNPLTIGIGIAGGIAAALSFNDLMAGY